MPQPFIAGILDLKKHDFYGIVFLSKIWVSYHIELINAIKNAVTISVFASSGAGCVEHFHEVFTRTEAEDALVAGIFHGEVVSMQTVKSYLKDKVEIRP